MNAEQKMKNGIRARDRKWFNIHLPWEMMRVCNVHHSWGNGNYCFILPIEEHRELEQKLYVEHLEEIGAKK